VVDVQNQPDTRKIPIDKVGVKNIKYPIIVLDKKNKTQHTIAAIDMFVDLPHQFKGTHMSRFIEVLNKYKNEITVNNYFEILKTIKEKLNAKSAHLDIKFPYFIEKKAPVSKAKSLMHYNCRFSGTLTKIARDKEVKDFFVEVEVPVTTLCPCSKELSKKGAHNQRGEVKVRFKFKEFIWIEDIIKIVENSGSSEVYALLKRPDEKYVTERAYDNPRFVEDVVRDVAKKLSKLSGLIWFSVEAENFESIHNHSAYAYLEKSRK